MSFAERILAATQVKADNEAEAGKLYQAITKVLGNPKDKQESGGEQEVTWKSKLFYLNVSLRKGRINVALWSTKVDDSSLTGTNAKTAKEAWTSVISQLDQRMKEAIKGQRGSGPGTMMTKVRDEGYAKTLPEIIKVIKSIKV